MRTTALIAVHCLLTLSLAAAAAEPDRNALLVVAGGVEAKSATAITLLPATAQNVTVFQSPGRYGGWPANGGMWAWGDELVVDFTGAWFKHATKDHAVDRSKPFEKWQARSLDGGLTWTAEKSDLLSDPAVAAKAVPLAAPLDFTQPDFAMMFQFANLHVGPSFFYVSTNRCRAWQGPFRFAVAGVDKIAARTDLIVLGQRDALMFASAAKANDKEGRTFCARTVDGGLTWKLVSFIGPEPEGFTIMPATVRLKNGALLTAIRHAEKSRAVIDVYRSDDLGARWKFLGAATGNIGGNPPTLTQLADGRLVLAYGYRLKPFGIRARTSADDGNTWSDEIVLRKDGLTGDLGYPRTVVRADGKLVTAYYFNGPRDEDRTIQATVWTPPISPATKPR